MRLNRQFPVLVSAGLLLGVATWSVATLAQDSSEADDEPTDAATGLTEDATTTDEALAEEEVVVDDGSYLDAEDEDFRPSEEIPADQSIAFPTDI